MPLDLDCAARGPALRTASKAQIERVLSMASSIRWIAVVAIDVKRMSTGGRKDFAGRFGVPWNYLHYSSAIPRNSSGIAINDVFSIIWENDAFGPEYLPTDPMNATRGP